MSFSFSQLHPSLARATQDMGFTKPTPVQHGAIPPGLEGRDVLACAMTGSGKTAAFLIPILERLLAAQDGTGSTHKGQGGKRQTRALVISPTRELAAQTVDHFNELARHTKLRAAPVYGGVGMRPQEQAFRRGVEVIVACPGRLLDHFQHPYARLQGLEVLVLDEADRMLDMGFLPDIKRVLNHLPKLDQRLLFSATMPAPIAELSGKLLEDPFRLDVERPAAPAAKVEQSIYSVSHTKKPALLLAMLQRNAIGNALVFTRTKHRADRLARALSKQGVPCDCIHGNRSQAQRTRALDAFRSGKTRVLVATDIAARGIDVEALSHVVNFDIPHMVEDYIHRVGRTARAEASGEAFTFVSSHEHATLRAIESAVGRLPRRELEGFDENEPVAGLWSPVSEGKQQQSQTGGRGANRTSPSNGRGAATRDRQADRGNRKAPERSFGRPAGPGRGPSRHGRDERPRFDDNRPARGARPGRPGDSRSERPDSRRPDPRDANQRSHGRQAQGPRHDRPQRGPRDDGFDNRRSPRDQHGPTREGRGQNERRHGGRDRDDRHTAGDRNTRGQGHESRGDDRRRGSHGAPTDRPRQGRPNQDRPSNGRATHGRTGTDRPATGRGPKGRPHTDRAQSNRPQSNRPNQDRPSQPHGRRPDARGNRHQGPSQRRSERSAHPHQPQRGSTARGADGSLIGIPRNENSEVEVFRAGQPQTSAFAQFERQGGKAPRKRRKAGSRPRS